jgi:hypothetical protein
LAGWDFESILKWRFRGLDQCVEHVVLMAQRRDFEAMKVNVGEIWRHGANGALVSSRMLVSRSGA